MLETGIYVRVSTEEQAQEGYSIRAQEQKLKDFAGIKEWSIYKIYIDEGISGKNITARPAVNEMIQDIKENKIKNVLVFKIDRLTRSTADLISLIDLFNTYDCGFNSLMESIDTQTATGRMFIKIIGIFAEFERESISERTRLGFERKVKEGYSLCTGAVSYGYDRKPGEKTQTINDTEAVIVREIFYMFIERRMSYLDIAKNLNNRKIPSKENSIWYATTIQKLLTNCNYAGNVRYSTKDEKRNFETKGVHNPIIDMQLYNDTQALIKKMSTKVYRKHPKETHYFAGILYCSKCGERLVLRGDYKRDENGNTIPGSYRCRNRMKKICNASDIRHIHVEEAFNEYICGFEDFDTLDEIQLATKKEIENRNIELIKELRKQLVKLEQKEKEILNQYVNGKVDFESYIEIKKIIDNEKMQISSTLENIETLVDEEITIKRDNIIKNLKENWDLLENGERRQFLIDFVERIELANEMRNKRYGTAKVTNIEFSKV